MNLLPSFEQFERGWAQGHNQLVYARLAADLDTPVSLMLKLAEARTDTFMLESVTGGEVRGRYSVVGMKPDLIWKCHGTTASINRDARFDPLAFTPLPGAPLDSLRALIAESRVDLPEGLPAIASGLFGYLGYDMIRLVEHLPNINRDPLGLPDAVLMRPSVVAVLDGVKGEVTLVAPAWAASGLSARAAYAQAAERVMDALRDLDRAPAAQRDLGEAAPVGEMKSNFSHEGYKQAVERAKDYIRAGDIFQVVPSQRWAQSFTLPPFALYRSLRRTNPSPFMFFFNFGGFQVIGASPEILVRLRDGEVTVRPIAGTRMRGATPEEDKALELDLLADKKELAEHLMLTIWAATTWVGWQKSARSGQPRSSLSNATATSCTSSLTSSAKSRTEKMRCRRCSQACPQAQYPARRKCARWRSLTSWSPKSAASMAAASAISQAMARWISASLCAPPC